MHVRARADKETYLAGKRLGEAVEGADLRQPLEVRLHLRCRCACASACMRASRCESGHACVCYYVGEGLVWAVIPRHSLPLLDAFYLLCVCVCACACVCSCEGQDARKHESALALA